MEIQSYPFTLQALLIAVLVYPTLYVFANVTRAGLSSLRSISGPFLTRFTRLWLLRQLSRGQFEQTNIQLHRKYG